MTNEREERIRQRAQEIWENEGRPEGRHEEHWRLAQKEIDNQASGAGATGDAAEAAQLGPSQGSSTKPTQASPAMSEGTKPDGAPPAQAQSAGRKTGSREGEGPSSSSHDTRQASQTANPGDETTSEGTKPDGAPPA